MYDNRAIKIKYSRPLHDQSHIAKIFEARKYNNIMKLKSFHFMRYNIYLALLCFLHYIWSKRQKDRE